MLRDRTFRFSKRRVECEVIGLVVIVLALVGLFLRGPGEHQSQIAHFSPRAFVVPRTSPYVPTGIRVMGTPHIGVLQRPGSAPWTPSGSLGLSTDLSVQPWPEEDLVLFPVAALRKFTINYAFEIDEHTARSGDWWLHPDVGVPFRDDPAVYADERGAPEWVQRAVLQGGQVSPRWVLYWPGILWNLLRLVAAAMICFGLWMIAGAPRLIRREIDEAGNRICPRCGYPLLADGDRVCSECGAGASPSA